jgi:hypothetical protein
MQTIQAPEWFISLFKESNLVNDEGFSFYKDVDLKKEFKKILDGESDPIIRQARLIELIRDLKKSGHMPDEKSQNSSMICNSYSSTILDYAWKRFRYENKDNDFGTAENLKYDDEKKQISIN